LQTEQYDVDEMATLVDEQRAIFNPDQAAAFDAIEKQRCKDKDLDNLFDLNYTVFILLPKCLEC